MRDDICKLGLLYTKAQNLYAHSEGTKVIWKTSSAFLWLCCKPPIEIPLLQKLSNRSEGLYQARGKGALNPVAKSACQQAGVEGV